MDKRFLLWILLSTLLMVGLLTARHWLMPPPEKQEEAAPAKSTASVREHAPALAGSLLSTPGTVAFATDLLIPKVLAAKQLEWQAFRAKAHAQEEERQAAANPDKDLEIGATDDLVKLLVVLSERGGAVRSITLKQHQGATRKFAEEEKSPLKLVNDDDDGKLLQQSPRERLRRQSFRFYVEGVDLQWTVREKTGSKVVFVAEVPGQGVTVVRTFEVNPGEYHVNHRVELQFAASATGEFTYHLTGPRGLPVEGMAWKTAPFRQVVVGTVEAKDAAVAYRKLVTPYELSPASNPKPELMRPANENREVQYAGVMVQYFGALIVIDGDPTKARWIDSITPEYLGDDEEFPKGMEKLQGKVTLRLAARPIPAEPGKTVTHSYLLFAGPVKVRLLNREDGVAAGLAERYERELHLNLLTDAPSDNWISRAFAYIGWNAMVVFVTNLMHRLLEFLQVITRHYGIAIILMTLIVRALMFPISRKQALASLRMQKLGPEIAKLKEKYKDKKDELMRAQMQLYRQHGVNPMSGCLVLVLQMPVFLGLYYALYESIDLRLASFLWIDNLAVPDALFNWENVWGLRWLAGLINLGPTFNILPLISVVLMVIQQKWMTPPPADDQQAMQMKMMNFMMIFMAYMFYWVPAGLCVYFIVSGAWGMLERKLLPRITHTDAKPATEQRAPVPTGGRRPSANGTRKEGTSMIGKVSGWWTELLKKAEKK